MKKEIPLKYMKIYETRIGNLGICSDGKNITGIYFNTNKIFNNVEEIETILIKQASVEIKKYLDGSNRDFTVPIKYQGTDFQKKVWKTLQTIPYGKTCSYKDIAEKIFCSNGCRAVGLANGKNQIPIIIPCHRVINASGNLGGFSGGLNIKKILLKTEGIDKYLE